MKQFIKHFWTEITLLLLMLIPIAGFYFTYKEVRYKKAPIGYYISGNEPKNNCENCKIDNYQFGK